jgi:hypothetical protein
MYNICTYIFMKRIDIIKHLVFTSTHIFIIDIIKYLSVANAFAIMGIVTAMFAVLAFDLFADRDPYNFGTFSKAYFTMFQVQLYACRTAAAPVTPPLSFYITLSIHT